MLWNTKSELCINIDAAKRTLNEQFDIYLSTKNIRETTKAEYRIRWEGHGAF